VLSPLFRLRHSDSDDSVWGFEPVLPFELNSQGLTRFPDKTLRALLVPFPSDFSTEPPSASAGPFPPSGPSFLRNTTGTPKSKTLPSTVPLFSDVANLPPLRPTWVFLFLGMRKIIFLPPEPYRFPPPVLPTLFMPAFPSAIISLHSGCNQPVPTGSTSLTAAQESFPFPLFFPPCTPKFRLFVFAVPKQFALKKKTFVSGLCPRFSFLFPFS